MRWETIVCLEGVGSAAVIAPLTRTMTYCLRFVCFIALCLSVDSHAHAEAYLTKEQALLSVFGADCDQVYDPKTISDELKKRLMAQGLWGEDRDVAQFFLCRKSGVTSAFALIDSEIGKHLPMTYIVGISPSGTVTKVELMVFREIRGWEVREKRFMSQFEAKSDSDKLVVGDTIANVSGATLSAQAMARGVRRALILWNYFYGPGN